MIHIREAVIVEGKYDQIRLSSLLDATIVVTNGFGIFKDKQRMAYIRRLAKERGLLVLTDSDGAGLVIRNYLASSIPPQQIRHAFVPEILGKEKRKEKPSKEGKLGVEGMETAALLKALERAGVLHEDAPPAPKGDLTAADMMELGLAGGDGSREKRTALLQKLGLPTFLSTNRLREWLNANHTAEEVRAILAETEENEKNG